MKIEDLKYFFVVCECGSLNQAAQKLFLSRQALMRCINNLENELNQSLFSRGSGGVELTEFGQMFYEKAFPLTSQFESLQNLSQEFARRTKNHLSFGIRGNFRSSHTLKKMSNDYSIVNNNLVIELIDCDESEIESYVLEGRLDLGYTTLPPGTDSLSSITLTSSDVVLLMHKEHPLACLPEISAKDLQNVSIMIASFSSHFVELFHTFMADLGVDPKNLKATVDLGYMFDEAVNGSVGLMMDRDAKLGIHVNPSQVKRRLSPNLSLEMGLIYHRDMRFSSPKKKFIDFLIENFQKRLKGI